MSNRKIISLSQSHLLLPLLLLSLLPSPSVSFTRAAAVTYVPVLHAGELGRGLLEVVVIAVGEGAKAASYQGHGAESGSRLAGGVGAGGVLFAVLAVPGGLQPVVGAREGHLHGCWSSDAGSQVCP